MNCGNETKMKKWSSQWTQFMQLRKRSLKKKFRTSTGFEPVISRYRCGSLPTELWSTDVGSRSIVGSYVPVKEMSVNDIWNKSYMKSVFRVSRARYEHKGWCENSRQLHNCPEFSQRRTYQATIFNPIRNKIIILDSKIVLFLRAYAIGLAFNCTLISRKKMSFYLFGFPCLWFP